MRFYSYWVYRTPINTYMFFITLIVKNATGNFSKDPENYLWRSSFLIKLQLASLQTTVNSFRGVFQRSNSNYLIWYHAKKNVRNMYAMIVWSLMFQNSFINHFYKYENPDQLKLSIKLCRVKQNNQLIPAIMHCKLQKPYSRNLSTFHSWNKIYKKGS